MYNIKKNITIDAPADKIFTALTTSEEIIKYFPLKHVSSRWQVGEEVLYHGEAGGAEFTDFGIIEVLDKPIKYGYRYWSDNHGTTRTAENYLSITYVLSEHGKGTMVEVTQSNIQTKALYDLMQGQVWDYLLSSLKSYIEKQ